MRSLNKPKHRPSNLKDSSVFSTSAYSKSFETGTSKSPKSPKFPSFISKYSMFKGSHQQKLLVKQLEDHGPSLVYNFKYKDIMESALLAPKDSNTGRLPTLSVSESPASRKNDSSLMRVTGGFATHSAKLQGDGPYGNQLKSRVFQFLKTEGDGESRKALDTFESEMFNYKERHRKQRENVYSILSTNEAEQMTQNIKDLTMESIKKNLPRNRLIQTPSEAMSPQSRQGHSSILRPPESPGTRKIRFKFSTTTTSNETSDISSPLSGKPSIVSINPGPLTVSARPSSTIRSPVNMENRLSSPLANMSSGKVSAMLESSRKMLDMRFSSYRPEPVRNVVKLVESPVEAPAELVNSPVSKVWSRMRVQKSMRMKNPVAGKFVEAVKSLVKKMDLLNLTIKQIQQEKIFPSGPYERAGSTALIRSAKVGDIEGVKKLIDENKFLVYDYDPMKQTALHWAVKRGYVRIAMFLLNNGADPDARDITGRTPLFFAAKCNSIPCIKLLLLYRANPMVKSYGNKMAIDCTTNDTAKFILRKAYKVQLILELCSPKKYKALWEKIDKRDFELKDSELQ